MNATLCSSATLRGSNAFSSLVTAKMMTCDAGVKCWEDLGMEKSGMDLIFAYGLCFARLAGFHASFAKKDSIRSSSRRIWIVYSSRAEQIARLACGKCSPMLPHWLGLLTFEISWKWRKESSRLQRRDAGELRAQARPQPSFTARLPDSSPSQSDARGSV